MCTDMLQSPIDHSHRAPHCRRRYDLAEKELIASKLDLHARSEVKEKLTEKLYLVINRNEQRKSQRLSQLMLELNHEGMCECMYMSVFISVVYKCNLL